MEGRSLRIFLARHGQTDWNAERRMQGWTDIGLNELGRKQALKLAAKFRDDKPNAIYCSALRRSKETAEIVANGIPVVSLPQLNERCLGVYEGQCLDLQDAAFLEEFRRRCLDPDDTLDNGESYMQHKKRIAEALSIIKQRDPFSDVLIIGHGGTNQLIMQILLDLPLSQLGAYHQENSDVYVIETGTRSFWKSIKEFHQEIRKED